MNARPLVAFHAPMKGPDHPVPSGDRTVARLYLAALRLAGFDVEVVSEFRSYDGKGDAERQAGLLAEAEGERARLLARWAVSGARRPDLWFTYHLYHKAPDLLGPDLAAALAIPYAVAEPSYAPKRAGGAWDVFFRKAEAALRAADVAFITTAADAECVVPLRGAGPCVRVPPFIDVAVQNHIAQHADDKGPVRLVCVAMMRKGDKTESYRILANALKVLADHDWHLSVAGDGETRDMIGEFFSRMAHRIKFLGRVEGREQISSLLAASDIFVWPAVNEAFGMALLEASAHGLPVVAGREGGVCDVVLDGVTGLLSMPRDAADFAEKLRALLVDAPLRRRMGAAGAAFVREQRGLDQAAAVLRATLGPLIGKSAT